MSILPRSRSIMSLFIVLAFFTTSSGQEGAALPDLGIDMTLGGSPQQIPITPAVIESGSIKLVSFEQLYMVPLRWQLEKHEIYQRLIEEETERIEVDLRELAAQREKLEGILAASGATTLDQIEKNALALQETKLELAVLAAEASALREAVKKHQQTVADKEAAMRAAIEKQVADGRSDARLEAKEKALRDAEDDLARVLRQVGRLEGEAVRQADAILDAMLSRLAQLEPQRIAMDAKAKRLHALTENATQMRRLIADREQVNREMDQLERRVEELETRLREQKLQAAYLGEMLLRYEHSLNKAKQRSKEKQELDQTAQ